jgi:hypothetical protein
MRASRVSFISHPREIDDHPETRPNRMSAAAVGAA